VLVTVMVQLLVENEARAQPRRISVYPTRVLLHRVLPGGKEFRYGGIIDREAKKKKPLRSSDECRTPEVMKCLCGRLRCRSLGIADHIRNAHLLSTRSSVT